ncbi:MAG: SusD/RagB family nutrient-binding outer membrane lipoprotein [Saprospiraceae bacterium]|nr:SusD/RagB family nutrient-binding outer membrane lipoprotein [Saprospiraceae bacterium]
MKYMFILLALIGMSSCEDFLDINENPNVATRPPLAGLLAVATYQTGINQFRVGSNTSFYTQYLASPNAGLGNDVYEQVDLSGTWNSVYDIMSDIFDLIQFAEEEGSTELVGVGKLLMAANLGLLVDLWGNVPYSDAFTGTNIIPTYDDAQGLYSTALSLIAEGRADIQRENSTSTIAKNEKSDFLLGGKKDNWLKFSYALEARYLNHFSKQGSYNPSAILAAVSNSFATSAEQAQVIAFEVRNPWANTARNNANLVLGGWLSEQFVDALNGTTFGVVDPRLEKITTPLPDGTSYVGTPNGAGRRGDGTKKVETYLDNSRAYASDNSPLFVFTFAELKFIEAEAALASNPTRALEAFLQASTHTWRI